MTVRVLRTAAAVAFMGTCLALAAPAMAQEATPEISFNAGVTSDYVWRGFSQSDEAAAVQGGIDLAYGNFYAGTWASTVDFGDGTDAEWDFYAGFTATTGAIDWDFGVTYYNYVGDPDGSDYNFVEFKIAASQTFDKFTLGGSINYSPDFYGLDEEATYVELTGEYAISDKWAVSGGIGQQFLDVGDDYGTWNLGASVNLTEKLSADLRYWDADVSSPLSDPRVVVTLGVAF
jgi:uncharacterized protein (TIGR02001 family)